MTQAAVVQSHRGLTPTEAAELAARREQVKAVMEIVTAIIDVGLNSGAVAAAEQLAELDLNQPDRLKFELEIEWILKRGRSAKKKAT